MWEKSISSKKNPYNLRQGRNNDQMNVIKLNFVDTNLFIELRRAVTQKLMHPLQQIWNLHRFSGCFFEATTVLVKSWRNIFSSIWLEQSIYKFVDLTDSSSNTQQTITLLAFASREHHVVTVSDSVTVTMAVTVSLSV